MKPNYNVPKYKWQIIKASIPIIGIYWCMGKQIFSEFGIIVLLQELLFAIIFVMIAFN